MDGHHRANTYPCRRTIQLRLLAGGDHGPPPSIRPQLLEPSRLECNGSERIGTRRDQSRQHGVHLVHLAEDDVELDLGLVANELIITVVVTEFLRQCDTRRTEVLEGGFMKVCRNGLRSLARFCEGPLRLLLKP